MNTSNLKRFAQLSRRKLITQVGARLELVLSSDSAELRDKTAQLRMLREEINRSSKAMVIDKVAYTWFNRLMALRFMDVNDYQPLGIRIVTPRDGHTLPEILQEAKQGHIPDELPVKKQHIFDLLDGRIPAANPQNEAYKALLTGVCNHLNQVFPFMFERINDYTELLLPDDLTSIYSIVYDIREGMQPEDCAEVEIIGWLYQFYISERKDQLINAKKKYKEDEIAPVTQLFTPKWIVQYMVDNTLGQLWMEARPSSRLYKNLSFYIKPDNTEHLPKRFLKSPEEIGFFDPCVGSAHILCYAFDIFYKIYEEEGYDAAEIPGLIITKNLIGIDIDERAAQLASFAVMMKGRKYSKQVFRKGIKPVILALKNDENFPKFEHATIFGSLIKVDQKDIDDITVKENNLFTQDVSQIQQQAEILAGKYDVVVTNPPYLNASYMEDKLKKFVEKEYTDTKSDLFACFLIQCMNFAKEDGLIGYISPYVWMFISSYEKLRKEVIEKTTISSLIQLEYNAFEPACVPVATFTLRNKYLPEYKGSYIKLSEFKGHENQAPKTLEAIQNPQCGWFFTADQNNFQKIPGNPIGYWLRNRFYELFSTFPNLGSITKTSEGIKTGENIRFLRYWHEVNKKDSLTFNAKWRIFHKGGTYRKWYGNLDYLINWENDGNEIKCHKSSGIQGSDIHEKEGFIWSDVTSGNYSARIKPKKHMFSNASPAGYTIKTFNTFEILGLLNTKFMVFIAKLLNPSMHFTVGNFRNVPLIGMEIYELLSFIAKNNILISTYEWNSREISWDFIQNELLSLNRTINHSKTTDFMMSEVEDPKSQFLNPKSQIQNQNSLSTAYQHYKTQWSSQFFQLHQNEEELNRNFIEIYGLQDELTPDVPLEEITILQQELDRGKLAKLNNKLKRDPQTFAVLNYDEINLPFDASEVMAQFASYAVGCMFGRYSLDKEGLILANQGETIEDFIEKVSTSFNPKSEILNQKSEILNQKSEITFLPDEDNIIPILDEEWFEDDIVNRFHQFLKVTFGEQNFSKNLSFIEEQLGKDIRKYFLKDFYPDHIRRYKKRPIYWMFSSTNGSFSVLIYMHRYTPDTINNILNKYLRQFKEKLRNRIEHLEHIGTAGTASEQVKADKEKDRLSRILIELQEYERDVLYPIATDRIPIDLDDGVLVNYNKFGRALKEVTGLNDKATKEKVKAFDWIDTTQIR